MVVQQCPSCGLTRWPPRPSCPDCGEVAGDWMPIAGCGEVFTWTEVHRTTLPSFQDRTPYRVAVIELPHAGIRMIGALEVGAGDNVHVGMHVHVSFTTAESRPPSLVWSPANPHGDANGAPQ